MPPSYETLMDISFATTDFVMAALAKPFRELFPNLPGMKANSKETLGSFFGGQKFSDTDGRLEEYQVWFWILLLALVAVYL